MELSQEKAHRITEYLDIQTPLKSADLAFVFGSMAAIPAKIALELYCYGVVNFIVLTGGINRKNNRREADEHLTYLLEKGVPENCIIVENKSTNTRENVIFARKVIEKQHSDLLQIQSIVSVAKWHHSRRAIMTLKMNLPAGIRYYAATYQLYNIKQENWWQNETGLHHVLKEWEAIPKYLEQGHIAEIHEENGAFV